MGEAGGIRPLQRRHRCGGEPAPKHAVDADDAGNASLRLFSAQAACRAGGAGDKRRIRLPIRHCFVRALRSRRRRWRLRPTACRPASSVRVPSSAWERGGRAAAAFNLLAGDGWLLAIPRSRERSGISMSAVCFGGTCTRHREQIEAIPRGQAAARWRRWAAERDQAAEPSVAGGSMPASRVAQAWGSGASGGLGRRGTYVEPGRRGIEFAAHDLRPDRERLVERFVDLLLFFAPREGLSTKFSPRCGRPDGRCRCAGASSRWCRGGRRCP